MCVTRFRQQTKGGTSRATWQSCSMGGRSKPLDYCPDMAEGATQQTDKVAFSFLLDKCSLGQDEAIRSCERMFVLVTVGI